MNRQPVTSKVPYLLGVCLGGNSSRRTSRGLERGIRVLAVALATSAVTLTQCRPARDPASLLSTTPGTTDIDGRPAPAKSRHESQSTQPSWQRKLQSLCGSHSDSLSEATERLAELAWRHEAPTQSVALGHWLRSHGAPVVSPQLWSISGPGLTGTEALTRYEQWASSNERKGRFWCGVGAYRSSKGQMAVAVVTAPKLGQFLKPVPKRVRVSQWITIEAHVDGASSAKVVVMGPRGRPKPVPTKFDRTSGTIEASFSADHPGEWTIQVLADRGRGPLPVLEAITWAGTRANHAGSTTSGRDDVVTPQGPPTGKALLAMINEARQRSQLAPLQWSTVDARAASNHLRAMRKTGIVAHDAGDGSPRDRLAALGTSPQRVGENVARASSLSMAHRALWASPSHRANILDEHFTHVGIAVTADDEGRIWVVEVFSSKLP